MQKLVLILTIGILMFSVGGCGSQEETEDVTSTPTPESSPAQTDTESTESDEKETDSEETQSQAEDFEDPLVEEKQKQQAAAEAGLIQSTKAEERLLQLKGSSNGIPVAAAPAQTPTDPFSVLPPLVVQSTPEEEVQETTQSLELNARQVPELPSLPVAVAPPSWRTEVVVATSDQDRTATGTGTGTATTTGTGTATATGTGTGTATATDTGNNKTAQGRTPSSTNNNKTAQGRTPSSTGNNKTAQGRTPSSTGNNKTAQGRTPSSTNNNKTAQGSQPSISTPLSPVQIPALPQLPSPPTPPPLQVAAVPDLPALPSSEPPQAWIDPNPPVIAEPPPPPSTTIAKAIAVTGVVRTESQTKVILKAPTEPTSRYVTVGQTIANGEVLVKRVKFRPDSDPIVIFEQNGVEVAIEVGSMPQSQEELNIILPPPPAINAFNQV